MDKKDLSGSNIGFLKVIEKLNIRERGLNVYKCVCECGNIKNINSDLLNRKKALSCGCKLPKDVRLIENIKNI
jgi:hypothetical protein